MKPRKYSLSNCPNCQQFIKNDEKICPFCDHKQPSGLGKALKRTAATAALFGMTAMLGCAYGVPEFTCKTDADCSNKTMTCEEGLCQTKVGGSEQPEEQLSGDAGTGEK